MKTTRAKVRALLAIGVLGALMLACAGPLGPTPASGVEPRLLEEVGKSGALPVAGGRVPKVALALGGGGLRGYAHVGVLQALEEAGIRPEIVVGTSAGAVVGAAYASGMTAPEIEAAALAVEVPTLIDWTLSRSGLMRGDHLASWVERLTGSTPIERFPIRFGAVATDLESGRAVLIDRGSAGSAIRASAAVPGVTVPVTYAGGRLVDGGVTSLVPVRFARRMGADVVIAVDIYCQGPRASGTGATSVVGRVMRTQNCLVAAPEMAEADVLIAPAIEPPGMNARSEKERAIQLGRDAASQALVNAGWTPERRARAPQ